MKIQYKDIIGNLVPEKQFGYCTHCCFEDRSCFPRNVYRCDSTIFEESECEVFKL